MNPYEQAERYMAGIPPAVSGSGGHNQTFSAACALVHGFSLSDGDAMDLLSQWNQGCQPPWTDAELVHKIQTVHNSNHQKPKGHLINTGLAGGGAATRPERSAPKSQPKTEAEPVKAVQYIKDDQDVDPIPSPLPDATRTLISLAFEPGEGVRIVPAKLNDEGKEVPDGEGPCLTREDWLKRLGSRGGDPNRIWNSAEKTGIYVAINPLKIGSIKDSDVTSYRHALLEFDKLSLEEQWTLYRRSNIPCTAVIHSGGKSIHAWVRVDAADRKEYDERVALIYAHFASYGCDNKNKNPSRLSRLPGCVRLEKRQELLAVNIGAESFSAWMVDLQTDGIGDLLDLDELASFQPAADESCLIGDRWLCKGGSLLVVGQSGIGKSSMEMQLAILWSLGRPAFGITPKRPLKSLIIQAENDLGDTAEMFQGVMRGIGISTIDDEYEELKRGIVIVRDSVHTGEPFTNAARRLIDRHKPDLVWLDPLLSFIGDDISKQEVCGRFLRNWLNPIAQATGVAWVLMHHTGKPPTDPKAQSGWKSNDFSYYGTGSSELTNWARGVVVLKANGDGGYELKLAKRGGRAGAKELDGSHTDTVTLRHGSHGIYWEQVAPAQPEESESDGEESRPGRPSKVDEIIAIGLGPFMDATVSTGETQNAIAKRLVTFCSTHRLDTSRTTAKKAIAELVARGRLIKGEDELYRRSDAPGAPLPPPPQPPSEITSADEW